jgi:uncharacterized membrane protein
MTSDSASRVTRSRRDLRLAVALLIGALAVVTALDAEETPKPAAASPGPAAATGPAAPAVPAEPEATPAEAAAPAADKPATAAAPDRKAGPSPGRFEPTEKVRADFDVSFPVDI